MLAMGAEQNKALIRRLVEARNERDDVTHDSLLADDWVVHSWWLNPVAQDGTPVREDKVVREQMRRNRELMREQYPTAREEINELFVADDTVTVVTTAQVTRRDGKTVTRKAIAVHRIAEARSSSRGVSGTASATSSN